MRKTIANESGWAETGGHNTQGDAETERMGDVQIELIICYSTEKQHLLSLLLLWVCLQDEVLDGRLGDPASEI